MMPAGEPTRRFQARQYCGETGGTRFGPSIAPRHEKELNGITPEAHFDRPHRSKTGVLETMRLSAISANSNSEGVWTVASVHRDVNLCLADFHSRRKTC
jgi:hypothetical protein